MPEREFGTANQLVKLIEIIRADKEHDVGRCPNCDEDTLEFNKKFEACEDCGYSNRR